MLMPKENTTYRTAEMRMDAIREVASRSTGVDTPEQREIVDQLARQIQLEPDPLVRETIIDTIAEFRTPLVNDVLKAGLNDSDQGVRRHCCEALGRRRDPAAVPVLAEVLRSEQPIDIRLAAVRALGEIKSPDAYATLATALEDRSPAMQYAALQAVEQVTGRTFDGNVSQGLAYAQNPRGFTPSDTDKEVSIASRLRELSPF